MLSLDTILTPNLNAVGRIVDEEAVLVLPDSAEVKVLNDVGSRIWELVDGTRTVREIINQICEEFDVDDVAAKQDTLVFVSEALNKAIFLIEPE